MVEVQHITEKDKDLYKDKSEYIVTMPHVEVRKCYYVERSFTAKDKDGKDQEHDISFLQVTVLDDEHDIIAYLRDPDTSHAEMYKRGTVGTFTLTVSEDNGFKGRTKINIASFVAEDD